MSTCRSNPIKFLLAAVLIIILTLLFFWKILLTNLILVGTDTFLYFYPYKAYAAESLRAGRIPLWNPHLFMGAPFLANSQVGLFYPLNWPLLWLEPPKQLAWSIGLHITLAGIGMLAFTRISLNLTWLAALTATILFAFGGYLGAQVEHINQLNAAAWLPLLFLVYDLGISSQSETVSGSNKQSLRAISENHGESLPKPTSTRSVGVTPDDLTALNRRWFLLLALMVALVLLAGHAQTAFIAMFGLGLYALWQALERGPKLTMLLPTLFRYLAPIAFVSVLATALAAIQLLPTAELSALSIRQAGLTFQEVVSFSTDPRTLHYTLLPPYGVDLSQIMGEAFSEWVAYLGISGLMLAGLGGVSALWQPVNRRFVFIALSGFGLSLGVFLGPLYLFDIHIGLDSELFHRLARISHPYYILYYLVPGFDLFRVPARWLLLYSFSMAILAGYGLQALQQPTALQNRGKQLRRWLTAYRWRWFLCLGLPILILTGLLIIQTPPLLTLFAWFGLTLVVTLLIRLGVTQTELIEVDFDRLNLRIPTVLRNSYHIHRLITLSPHILLIILTAELFMAAQTLNYNQPTAPQAYHSMRNAVAFLRSVEPSSGPADRFLSLSGTRYDPGDLADLRQIFGERLTQEAFFKLMVATKQKEVLFFNLPMIYRLHSVDGYDGGILPLAQFVTLQKLFLPEDNLSIDGRLREKLRYIPPGRLLSLLNSSWIITDKQFDAWIEGIFYDLQFPARLTAGQATHTTDIPDFPTTAIGLVSHIEGGGNLPENSPVADITVIFEDGQTQTFPILVGQHTAEGLHEKGMAHSQATVGVGWPYGQTGVSYISTFAIEIEGQHRVTEIRLTAQLPEGEFVLRGLSLIHGPTTTSRSVILSTEGDYRRVHSGDVKIYENRGVLPRAYITHQRLLVKSADEAILQMKQPTFKGGQSFIQIMADIQQSTAEVLGQPSAKDKAVITSYQPEQVALDVSLDSPGWLILTDTAYPGWQATVNGQPTEIMEANVMFRAVKLPAGKHTVRFEFISRSFHIGLTVSGITFILVLTGLCYLSLSKVNKPEAE